jgi:hypothetical protein
LPPFFKSGLKNFAKVIYLSCDCVTGGYKMLESIGIIVAMATGIGALIFSLVQAGIQKKRDKELQKKERLYFLANIIVDKNIARKSRQIFYDEYVALGGNGSFVKFWLEEETAQAAPSAPSKKQNKN